MLEIPQSYFQMFDVVLFTNAAVLTGRYSNGKVWAIGAKNSATGTEMFGGKVDESAQTLTDPQWGTKYSLVNGDVVGKWCPSPPIIGSLIGALFPPQGVWVPEVRESGGYIEVKLDVDVSYLPYLPNIFCIYKKSLMNFTSG